MFSLFILYPIVMAIWFMSKHRRSHHKHKKKVSTGNSGNQTIKQSENPVRREPIEVMQANKYSSGSKEDKAKFTINNTYPGKKYKVVTKPEKWSGNCHFVGQIGMCMGTDHVHGAKLKFISGEIICIPFDNIEQHDTEKYKVVNNPAVVSIEAEKGKYYKVIKKPAAWNTHCKYVDQTGLCITVDDRGARLRFSDGNDLSFQSDSIVETPAIDLNKVSCEVTEDTVQIGDIYRITKRPDKFGPDADKLIGLIGKTKWVTYRGVCLKFPDGSGYIIPFDCLEKYQPQKPPNPVIVPQALNADNIVIHRKYKVLSLPQDFAGNTDILGKLGKVLFASGVSKSAMLKFDDGYQKQVPFICLQELARPSETELVDLIKQHPERILRIIKGLSKVTRLKPVIDFVQRGILPEAVESEMPAQPVPTDPVCMSETTPSPVAGTIGDTCDGIMNNLVAAINGPVSADETMPAED